MDLDTQLNWVVSYPKSGNTWIRNVARAYVGNDLSFRGVGRIGDVAEQVWHDVSPVPLKQLTMTSEVQLRPAALLNLALMHEDAVTLLKSHHGFYTIQQMKLWKERWVASVVNPVRDPREVCCSAHHHFGHDTYQETAEFMNKEGAHIGGDDRPLHHFIGTWSQHVKSWLEADLDVLTVRYEDMHAAPMQCFEEIMTHVLGEEPNMEVLEKAVEECAFEKMQEREAEHGYPEATPHQDQFFRRGETDGWKDELPSEVADKIVEDHADMMDELGYL